MIFQVIMESLRMASIISFTYREAVDDVYYKGKYLHHIFTLYFFDLKNDPITLTKCIKTVESQLFQWAKDQWTIGFKRVQINSGTKISWRLQLAVFSQIEFVNPSFKEVDPIRWLILIFLHDTNTASFVRY